MNLPTLPTDSVYKFLALGGLALVILSPGYYQIMSLDVQLKNNELRAQQATMQRETDYLVEDAMIITEKITEVVKEVPDVADRKTPKEQARADKLLKDSKELQQKNDELGSKIREKELKLIQIEKMEGAALLYNDQLNLLKWISIAGFSLGVILLSTGLYLWFTRVQKLQDMILRKEAGVNERVIPAQEPPPQVEESQPVEPPRT